jgi:hypothetical protein
LLGLGAAAAIAACSSDDAAGGGTDAGTDVAVTPPQPPPPPAGGDSGGTDSGADVASDSGGDVDAGPRACTVGPIDASTPALTNQWSATAPIGNQPVVVAGTIVQPACTIVLATIEDQPVSGPPSWVIYLEKKDTTAGSCAEPKGYRALFTSYITPAAFLAESPLDPTLFVVAFDHKNSISGSSTVQLSMAQYDWTTGDVLHSAIFAVKGSSQLIPPGGMPTALSATGCDVTLSGTGTFPGATGTNTFAWTAHYLHFLAPEPQPASNADDAAYQ